MLPVAHPDQLQPSGPGGEFEVAVDVPEITVELGDVRPAASLTGYEQAPVTAMRGVPIRRVAQRQIANRRARTVEPELGLQVRLLEFRMVRFDATFGEDPVFVGN